MPEFPKEPYGEGYSDESIGKVVAELQAGFCALVEILTSNGTIDREEFKRKQAQLSVLFEDRRTTKMRENELELHEEVRRLMLKVQAIIRRIRPAAQIDLLIPEFDPSPKTGGLAIRVIDPHIENTELSRLAEILTEFVCQQTRFDEYFNWLLPIDVAVFQTASSQSDPLCLKFSIALRHARLQISTEGVDHGSVERES